jgi:energy-converting hydrogenase Eha subunit A
MKASQRFTLIVGLAIIAAMLAYPPFQRDDYYRDRGSVEYSFIFSQPFGYHLDITRLVIQVLAAAIITLVAYLVAGRKRPLG